MTLGIVLTAFFVLMLLGQLCERKLPQRCVWWLSWRELRHLCAKAGLGHVPDLRHGEDPYDYLAGLAFRIKAVQRGRADSLRLSLGRLRHWHREIGLEIDQVNGNLPRNETNENAVYLLIKGCRNTLIKRFWGRLSALSDEERRGILAFIMSANRFLLAEEVLEKVQNLRFTPHPHSRVVHYR